MTNVEIKDLNLPDADRARAGVKELLAAAAKADGADAFSEQFVLGLDDARVNHRHFIATEDDTVVGVLASDGSAAEMAVAPAARRRGIATQLVRAAGVADVWAHGNLPAARGFAAAADMHATRELLVMAVEGTELQKSADAAEQRAGDGIFLNYTESVEKWGAEHVDAEWLRVNNDAFDWHPEQGGWDSVRLDRAREVSWYDPADVILLWASAVSGETADAGNGETADAGNGETADAGNGETADAGNGETTDAGNVETTDAGNVETTDAPRLMGFHWTKWHTEETPAFGEVYVVGLASDYRGGGRGGPLISAGLRRLVEKGARRVILYVEGDNEAAVKAYEKLGFSTVEEHVVYSRDRG